MEKTLQEKKKRAEIQINDFLTVNFYNGVRYGEAWTTEIEETEKIFDRR